MKIGLARRGYSATGGAEAYLTRFARALVPAGHEAVLFATAEWPQEAWPGGFGSRGARGARGAVLPGSSPRAFADALERERAAGACDFLFSLERVWRCDAYRAGDGVHRAWLERRRAVEPFWRRWGRAFNGKHRELLRLEERLFSPEGAGRVIANSRMVKEEIVRFYGYPAGRIQVVYNGLPPREGEGDPGARARMRARFGVGEGEMMILFAGSGWERKGLRQAIRAFDQARFGPARPARLVVVGRGNPRAMPQSARVEFAGPVRSREEMEACYAAADLFLLPTLYDPFSNACLEAMAAGLPVVTTAANGFAEILQAGTDGEVVDDPLDIPALARALEAWGDPARLADARLRLRRRALEFSIAANVRETLAALELPAAS